MSAAAVAFAKEGASVVIHGQSENRLKETEALLKAAGIPSNRILAVLGPIEKEETLQAIINKTIDTFGKINVLINNAGTAKKPNCDPSSTENLDYVYSVNVRAPFRLTELCLPYLQKCKGNIINISSISAFRRLFESPMHTAYGMSKAALDAFTFNECPRLAKMGIRINNLNPGPVKTFIAERNLPKMTDDKKQDMLDKSWEYWNKHTPIGRAAEPSEMTPTLLLLASDESAGFVTGAHWVIDGGMTCFANDMPLYD
uniref:Uncharacterized protein n=1 Tax=Panagrolaimus sp. PS1159 TaxID=55785 RepID=A0AC35EZ56_9BILA